MKLFTHIFAIIALSLLAFTGCSAKNQTKVDSNKESETPKIEHSDKKVLVQDTSPDWLDKPGHGNSIGIGDAYIGEKSLATQRRVAVQNAQVEMARNLKAEIGELSKKYEAIGGDLDKNTFDNIIVNYTESLVKETLKNSQVEKTYKDKEGNLYVLLSSYKPEQYALNDSSSSRGDLDAKWSKFHLEQMQKEYEERINHKIVDSN